VPARSRHRRPTPDAPERGAHVWAVPKGAESPRTAGNADPPARVRMSDEERHRLAMLFADLIMADLARRSRRE